MIASLRDLMVLTEADFERLPEDGRFEVVDGRAILLPPSDYDHQYLSDHLVTLFRTKLKAHGYGFVVSAVNVRIPAPPGAISNIQNRVPDVVVSLLRPRRQFEVGQPPELVIEILSTPRGNVERTEKLDDYTRAGIKEYWIVDPFERRVEVYLLRDGDYELTSRDPQQPLRPQAFPGLEITPGEIWQALG